MEWIKPGTNYDFVGKSKIAIAVSVLIVLIGIASLVARGGFNMGIDFTGGTELHVGFKTAVEPNQVRDAARDANLGDPSVQRIGADEQNEYLIRVATVNEDAKSSPLEALEGALNEKFGADSYTVLREDVVGPRAGQDLRNQGMWAVLLSILGILIYIGVRFDFKFGAGAILALVHDTLIMLAFFSLFQVEITLTIIAAILTIIGFSVNDTVIVFDRIRENMRSMRTKKFSEVVNKSVNETFSRTLLTSLTMLMVTVVLYLWGGTVLRDFAFALIVGVVAGTFSTIYIASPFVIWWTKDAVVTARRKKR
jgi:preprotein translocase subunit SecF